VGHPSAIPPKVTYHLSRAAWYVDKQMVSS
jgi:hypothetical protein